MGETLRRGLSRPAQQHNKWPAHEATRHATQETKTKQHKNKNKNENTATNTNFDEQYTYSTWRSR